MGYPDGISMYNTHHTYETYFIRMKQPDMYINTHINVHLLYTYETYLSNASSGLQIDNWVLNDRSGVQAVWPKSQVHAALQEDERGKKILKHTKKCQPKLA